LNIKAIIETAIYVADLDETEAFCGTILGLTVITKEPGRHVFFQVGASSVLLAFIAETTLRGDYLPPHGAKGPGHFALGIEADALDAWSAGWGRLSAEEGAGGWPYWNDRCIKRIDIRRHSWEQSRTRKEDKS